MIINDKCGLDWVPVKLLSYGDEFRHSSTIFQLVDTRPHFPFVDGIVYAVRLFDGALIRFEFDDLVRPVETTLEAR